MRNIILLSLFLTISCVKNYDIIEPQQKVKVPIGISKEYVNITEEPMLKSIENNDIYVITIEGQDDFIYGVFDNPNDINEISLTKGFTYNFNCFILEKGTQYFHRYGVGKTSSRNYSEVTGQFLYMSKGDITESIDHIGWWGTHGDYSYYYHPSTRVWRVHKSIFIDDDISSNGIDITAEAEYRKYIFKCSNVVNCNVKISSKDGKFEDVILTPESNEAHIYISTIANYGSTFDILVYKVTDAKEELFGSVSLGNRPKYQYTVDITVPDSNEEAKQTLKITKEDPSLKDGGITYL